MGTEMEIASESRQLVHDNRGAAWALAQMSDEEFKMNMEMAKKGRERLQQVMRNMMKVDVHFGKVPNTDKPTLLKPGAELLCQMFHLVAEPTSEIRYGDGKTSPHITVQARCIMHLGDIDGPAVGVGEAAANSWEKKWRWRQGQRLCPNCGKPAIIKGKKEYGGGWLCWSKKDGCNTKFADGDPQIESQSVDAVENPDPYELLNTIVKIANKRAKMDAVISATASSDLLTQDVGDDDSGDHEHAEPQKQEQHKQEPPKTEKPKPKLPVNGIELLPILEKNDAIKASAGKCLPGDYLSLIRNEAMEAGFSNDIASWEGDVFEKCKAIAREVGRRLDDDLISMNKQRIIEDECVKRDLDTDTICEQYQIKSLDDLPKIHFDTVMAEIKKTPLLADVVA